MEQTPIERLEDLLQWSQRLGSDEIDEIRNIITQLKVIEKK